MGARAILDSLLVEHPVTDTFKRWFSGSKVVDSRGNPKMVYHGTDSEDFETFERTEDIGFHFGTARQASARVGASPAAVKDTLRSGGPFEYQSDRRLIPVYLRIRNPLRMPDLNDWAPQRVSQQLVVQGVITSDEADAVELVDQDQVRAWLVAKGYDGVVYRNRVEAGGTGDSYIVFDPAQVKSAYALDFDPGDPRFGR